MSALPQPPITHCPVHPKVELMGESPDFWGRPNAGYCPVCNNYFRYDTGKPVWSKRDKFWARVFGRALI